jgi:hypothetical protein
MYEAHSSFKQELKECANFFSELLSAPKGRDNVEVLTEEFHCVASCLPDLVLQFDKVMPLCYQNELQKDISSLWGCEMVMKTT